MAAFGELTLIMHEKVSEAAKADIFLASEVLSVRLQQFTVFALMTAMMARPGKHAPQQVFVLARRVEEDEQLGACFGT